MRTYFTIRVEAVKVRPLPLGMEISNQIEGMGELSFIDDEDNVRRIMGEIDKLFSKNHVVSLEEIGMTQTHLPILRFSDRCSHHGHEVKGGNRHATYWFVYCCKCGLSDSSIVNRKPETKE